MVAKREALIEVIGGEKRLLELSFAASEVSAGSGRELAAGEYVVR
jgi:hypothetical protein